MASSVCGWWEAALSPILLSVSSSCTIRHFKVLLPNATVRVEAYNSITFPELFPSHKHKHSTRRTTTPYSADWLVAVRGMLLPRTESSKQRSEAISRGRVCASSQTSFEGALLFKLNKWDRAPCFCFYSSALFEHEVGEKKIVKIAFISSSPLSITWIAFLSDRYVHNGGVSG